MTYEQFGSNGGVPQYADYDDQSDEGLPEPESVLGNALTRFEAEWEAGLREKALVEERKRAEALKQGEEDLESFMAERASMRDNRMSQNRTQEQVFLEQLEAELETENPWERIVSIIDTQAEPISAFDDVGRMKTMLIQLKNDPK